MKRTWAFLLRTIAAIRILARDERIPKPLRLVAGIGLLPIPGPVDEVVLLLVAPVFVVFFREPMREAWSRSEECSAVSTRSHAHSGPSSWINLVGSSLIAGLTGASRQGRGIGSVATDRGGA